jgi:hypothetical protein
MILIKNKIEKGHCQKPCKIERLINQAEKGFTFSMVRNGSFSNGITGIRSTKPFARSIKWKIPAEIRPIFTDISICGWFGR